MADTTPKGYWMVHLTVHDAGGFMAYMRASRAIFKDWNARYVVQAGQGETREGAQYDKQVVVEFDSYRTARECYESTAYQDAIKLRDGCADFHLAIVEGVS